MEMTGIWSLAKDSFSEGEPFSLKESEAESSKRVYWLPCDENRCGPLMGEFSILEGCFC